MKRFALALVWLSLAALVSNAQVGAKQFSKQDSLRGQYGSLRSCYDINYYHLDVRIDPIEKTVSGSNEFRFTAVTDFSQLQIDLFSDLKIDKIVFNGTEITYQRTLNAVFLAFPSLIKKGSKQSFKVFYSGSPNTARNPPWDGGFIFSKDRSGNPWISVACQGFGASSWWPTKDHQSDEVDSMQISITIPKGLNEISNGRLRSIVNKDNGWVQYNWFVSNPINNYNVTFYIGKYAHWTDKYAGEKGSLSLDYWSLAEDSLQARPHWEADTRRMLQSFEHWFGPYPFYEDGYKLVQAPFLGMEHQSAVAYGNKFKMGYLGRDYSKSAANWGLKFDYITIHESGHEWFGNNITSKDIADMWIHESFTSYSEVLFLETYYGKQAGSEYVISSRKIIRNDQPIIGPYNVNTEGSSDMYYKGANVIHTLRQLIGNDEKFRGLLRGLNKTFYHQTVTTNQVESYISKFTGLKLTKFFDQYLRTSEVPVLEYNIDPAGKLAYRWVTEVQGFDMPLKVTLKDGTFSTIYPTNKWQSIKVDANLTNQNFKVDSNYFINIRPGKPQ
ncbi:M1 family metallopeptidase [Pedobacter sp. PWIIR3]